MKYEQRQDRHCAKVIDAGIRMDTLWGCVSAWHYLQLRRVTPAVAARVLSKAGPRRREDALHPAVRDALATEPRAGIGQRADADAADAHPQPLRTNLAAALAVERAIGLCGAGDRHYAESLLRIYGLPTATIMRVLFESRRRRGPATS
ncbi:hypothetical protein FHW58_004397 [Duganella sp. 1224]|uniref:hypothetical protein n=1 Tax=Duganella sp. 1224 TaxID=2587052 RepID=UPI0015C6BEFC|nr:hypothetical protein [Duganella sp. 1224]NYE63169.1 hypothetical protein [Duganella sp. 1224]